MIERLRAWLGAPRDVAGLVAFRVVFGLLVSVSATRFLAYGWVDQLFDTRVQFHYWGFAWVPWPGLEGVRALFVALVVLGLCVTVGLLYRVTSVLLFVCFGWLQLLDVSTYLNHYYLVTMLALLLCFMPLNRAWAIDAWAFPSLRSQLAPWWCTVLLRFQLGLVYVFAGLAKLNTDWLVHGAPLHLWLSARSSMPVVGPWLSEPMVALMMSWAGFLFDTTVPFFLLWRRTRSVAYVVVIIFHSATWALFPIGMFPFIMTLCALIFFESGWPRRLLHPFRSSIGTGAPAPAGPRSWEPAGRTTVVVLVAWAVVQVALPLRAHLYGGDVSWHEQGMRFSWRVMTREKNGSVTYVVKRIATGREWHVDPKQFLTSVQERELAVQPDLILQLGRHIGNAWSSKGLGPVEVRADTLVSLNGRRATPLVDPTVDLMSVDDTLAAKAWILPGAEGRPLSALSNLALR